ncbi:MAG: hypothetical protein IJQ67_00585 [Bacilli bacterium]|nr:hypothetical protein [Bacilli bacterium]
MTQEEAINARELLLVEQRKVRQAIRILQSESIIPCAGISMAIGQYNRRLHQIDENIREIAEQYSLSLQEEGDACAVEFQMVEEAPATAPEAPVAEAPAVEAAPAVETPTAPVEETTVSVAETVAHPATPAQPGMPDLSQFTEQQIADAIVQLAMLCGVRQ